MVASIAQNPARLFQYGIIYKQRPSMVEIYTTASMVALEIAHSQRLLHIRLGNRGCKFQPFRDANSQRLSLVCVYALSSAGP